MQQVELNPVTITLQTLDSVDTSSGSAYAPIGLEDLQNSSDTIMNFFSRLTEKVEEINSKLSEEVHKIDPGNLLTAYIVGIDLGGFNINEVERIYSFSLQNINNTLYLKFGNCSLKVEVRDEENYIITGFNEKDLQIKISGVLGRGEPVNCYLKVGGVFGERQAYNIYPVFKEETDFPRYSSCVDLAEVVSLYTSWSGGIYAKLIDFVLPHIESGRIAPESLPIILNVESWEFQEHPEYGESAILKLRNAPQALVVKDKSTKQRSLVVPTYVTINESYTSFKLLSQPEVLTPKGTVDAFQKRALQVIADGGLLLLVIQSLHPKKPTEWRPNHILRLIEKHQITPALQSKLQSKLSPSIDDNYADADSDLSGF